MNQVHTPFRILVLCTGNTARSQIAEAIIMTRGLKRPAGMVIAESAGSKPGAKVNEYAVVALQNHGITWRDKVPKSLDTFMGQKFDLVITVCDDAKESCPFFPGASVQAHWGLPDPAGHISPATARAAFAGTFDALFVRINALLRLPLEMMDPATLKAEVQGLHDRISAPTQRTSARLRHNT